MGFRVPAAFTGSGRRRALNGGLPNRLRRGAAARVPPCSIATAARPGYESSVSLPHKNQHQQRSLSLAAYPNPHDSPLAQRARKAETGPDAVLKLAQRTWRAVATGTAAGLPAPGRAPGVQTATPETSSSGWLKAPPAARKRTRMPGTITTRPPEPGRHGREGRTSPGSRDT